MVDSNSNAVQGPGAEPVSKNGIIGIGIYLLVLSTFLFCLLYWSWPRCSEASAASKSRDRNTATEESNAASSAGSARTKDKEKETPESGSSADSSVQPTGSNVSAVSPQILSISPASGRVDAETHVTVKGSGFQPQAKINFGGRPGDVIGQVAEDSITAIAPLHHAAKVDVVVINPNGTSASLAASFEYTCNTIADAHVLWLVILAGAIGGTIHAIRSLYWYVGNRELCWSWVPMYILLPFSGAAIATVFFLIVRGGFLNTTPDRETAFGIIAIAALTGLFSQQAALKLQDIANAVLAKPEPGANSKPQAALPVGGTAAPVPARPSPTMIPTNGPAAGGTPIQIRDTGFTSVKSLTFDGNDATELRLDATSTVITAKSPAHVVGEVNVILTDDDDKTLSFKFRYE